MLLNKLKKENCLSMRYRITFVYGNMEPDINVLTYFHNAFHSKRIKGHNYGNSFSCINKLVRKIMKKDKISISNIYRIGKLLHYTADCFTYVHNDAFTGNDRQHIRYECNLHKIFNELMSNNIPLKSINWDCESLNEVFGEGHRQYLYFRKDEYDDIRFILWAVSEVMYFILDKLENADNMTYQSLLCSE